MAVAVSIIIPAYNVEKYIEECIRSVISQTFSNMEIIVVDDGSTDNTAEIVEQIDDYRIILLRQSNKGVSEARNRAISIAKGNFILCLDSDDMLHQETVAQCYELHTKYILDAVTFDGYSFIDTTRNREKRNTPYFDRAKKLKKGLYKKNAFFQNTIEKKAILVGVPFYMFRKEFISKFPFQKDMIHEDVYFHYEILPELESIYYLPEKFYQRRIRKGSIVHSTPSLLALKSYEKIFLRLIDNYCLSTGRKKILWRKVLKKNVLQIAKITKRYLFSQQKSKREVWKRVNNLLRQGNLAIVIQNYLYFYLAFSYFVITDARSALLNQFSEDL